MRDVRRIMSVMILLLLVSGQLAAFVPAAPPEGDAGDGTTSRVAESGYWVEVSPLNIPRYDHTMHVLLNDSIVVIGGRNATDVLSSVEEYDPYLGWWGHGPSLSVARWGHASVKLQNNSVLVAGGYDASGDAVASAELLVQSGSSWYSLPDMPFAAGGANLSAHLLINGSVLVVGGNSGSEQSPAVATQAAVFDVTNDTWSSIPLPTTSAMGRGLYMLLNHTMVAVGGSTSAAWYDGVRSTDLYDPVTETWTALPDMSAGRAMFDGTVLGSGNLMVTGGVTQMGPGFSVLRTTERFNITTGSWQDGPAMVQCRYGHTATLLNNGEVLIVGGMNVTTIHNGTEVLQPIGNVSVKGPTMHQARTLHTAALNSQGQVVVAGGMGDSGPTSSVELFTPGVQVEEMAVEVFAAPSVESSGEVLVQVHTYNDTTGDVPGVLISLNSGGLGEFSSESGQTDEDGVLERTYTAPRNTGRTKLPVSITLTAYKFGYEDLVTQFVIEVFPETSGEDMHFNDSIYHLRYVTLYGPGSPYLEGSNAHLTEDFLGDELVMLDGSPVVVANFSFMEDIHQFLEEDGLTYDITSNLTGHRYFDYNVDGILYSYSMRTTRSRAYNETSEKWYNTTEERTVTYLPFKRWFNTSADELGAIQGVTNTFRVTTTKVDLNTGSKTVVTKLDMEAKDFVLKAIQNVSTFLGDFPTNVFLDETGWYYDHYSPDLGILLQTVEVNDTGEVASTKMLVELNELVGEDPTHPQLHVELAADSGSVLSGKGTALRARVTTVSGSAPVEGATVTFSHGGSGVLDPATVVTDASGWANTTFTSTHGLNSTVVDFTALAEKAGHRSASAKTSIMVYRDSTMPTFVHRPVTMVDEGEEISVFALVSDDIGVSAVHLHYRLGAVGNFTTLDMEEVLGAYGNHIPGSVVGPPVVQYYISAEDVNGNVAFLPAGGAADPFNISVTPKVRVLQPVGCVLTGGGNVTVTVAARGNIQVTVENAQRPGGEDDLAIGIYARVEVSGNGTFVWANISFGYRDPMLGGLDEADLRVFRWDGASGWGQASSTGVLPEQNIVWANVSSLSVFAPRATKEPVIPPEPDTSPPTVVLTAPKHNGRYDEGVVTIGGIAKDDKGLSTVEVSVDGGRWVNVWVPEGSLSSGWGVDIAFGPGEHNIRARSVDQAGHVSDETYVTIKVFQVPSMDGSEERFVCLMALALIIAIIVAVYLLAGKREFEGPDDTEVHFGPPSHDEDDYEDDLDDEELDLYDLDDDVEEE